MLPWNHLPFNDEMKKSLSNLNPNEIDKYVQNMVSKMFPKNMDGMLNPQEWLKSVQNIQDEPLSSNKLDTQLFETHDFVFIRIPIKEDNWLKNMKVFHTSHEAIIEHIPTLDDKHILKLPAAVKKKGAVANHRNGILEIRIPRSNQNDISEIGISEDQ
ncbi:Hsp20/alpha crystallin family protein [Mesobacillus maritimus]|uniref:Hsp20/alpha crystallin family protein n=1 Tax=Mesobacillus maritimus TaxID=1643336 RepID=UPI00203D5D84|nr:Hsp20/alpha crystallin family protein [Mesobacillus maritimus]MCM3588038.1 Hsp20/alpha crystallin family protein [Mesobacillus maritimus]MCM3668369.1 Hsp20/alpha crystallin family protein [Mesobacillus maritimus]